MHALIVGGGIAGLTSAIALRQHGWSCEVFEAAPALKPAGAGIWLAPNALDILHRLGQLDNLIPRGQFLKYVSVADSQYKPIQSLETIWPTEDRNLQTLAIHRAQLQAGLLAGLPEKIIHTDKKLAFTDQSETKAIAHFVDGTSAEGDVIIGADGIHSTTRQDISPAARIRFAGQTCWRGISDYPLEGDKQHQAMEVWGTGRRFGFSPVSKDKVYWFAVEDAEQDQILPQAERKPYLIDRFQPFGSPITDLIDFTPPDTILQNDIIDLLPLKTWSEGRVGLIGDAAHATTPNMGQGGCQAIEDAWFLPQFLQSKDSPAEAFQAFYQFRKKRVNKIVRLSWRLGKMAHFSFAPELRNWMLRITPNSVQKKQLNWLYTLPQVSA